MVRANSKMLLYTPHIVSDFDKAQFSINIAYSLFCQEGALSEREPFSMNALILACVLVLLSCTSG